MTDNEWEPHVDRRLRKPKRKAHQPRHEEKPTGKREKRLRQRLVDDLRSLRGTDDLDDESEM